MSYLQKLRHIFSSRGFYFIAYRLCCGWSRRFSEIWWPSGRII